MDVRSAYRETSARGASPVQLILLLYEQVIQDLRRALAAIERRDIESRTREINHAVNVLGLLQATLDTNAGGQVARNLERFYLVLRLSLQTAQLTASAKILRELIDGLLVVREAWVEVERDTAAAKPQ